MAEQAEQNGRKIFIFDTTLRDGEQAPGAAMDAEKKLIVARRLLRLNPDIIEAGFPASHGDKESVQKIAEEIKGPVICALARVLYGDIDAAAEALKPAIDRGDGLIHVFVGTSDVLIKKQLKLEQDDVLKMAVEGVEYARTFCPKVEFSAMDAGRTDIDYLADVICAVIEAGATIVNIPDTVGWNLPYRFAEIITELRKKLPDILKKVVISVHCHDDLGMATAESIAAVMAGATQVECAVNGMGERSGNAPLEEIVMNILLHGGDIDAYTNVNIAELVGISRLVSRITGFSVSPNKAIVGSNVPKHGAAIHQDGHLKDPRTFRPYDPALVGHREDEMEDEGEDLGPRSSPKAFRKRLLELGYEMSDEQLGRIVDRLKDLAGKKTLYAEDLITVAEEEMPSVPQTFSLAYIQATSGTNMVPTVTIGLRKGEEILQEAAYGDGQVNAAYKAIEQITGVAVGLEKYSLTGATPGSDAMGKVVITVLDNGRTIIGQGASTDIVEASAKAYIDAINKILHWRSAE